MPKGIPLTEAEQSRRRHEIFAAVAPLFLEHGFTETSMREIAQAAGMGKSSLYDYFETKDEILLWYFEDEISDMAVMAREIASQPLLAAFPGCPAPRFCPTRTLAPVPNPIPGVFTNNSILESKL